MTDKLPSLDELQQMRAKSIDWLISSHLFATVQEVTEFFGEHKEVKHHVGEFFEYEEDGFTFESYAWEGPFIPRFNRFMRKRFIRVAENGKLFVKVSLREDTPDPYEDDFAVKGAWLDKLYELEQKMLEKKKKSNEENDLELRKQLARMLHLIE